MLRTARDTLRGICFHAINRATLRLVVVAFAATFPTWDRLVQAAEPEDGREILLQTMREKADGTQVRRLGDAAGNPLPRMPEPLLRYSDDPRAIVGASLWGFADRGRPAALVKIEYYQRPGAETGWFYCFVSLSDSLIAAEFEGGLRWKSSQPAVQLATFPDSSPAAGSEVARRVQMRNLARLFSARVFGASYSNPTTQEQMRLLARPLCRYADAESGLHDGALFGFATNGTNPDLLLLVELRGPSIAEATWQYGLVRMTTEGVTVHLEEREVWAVKKVHGPPPPAPARFDTWIFFFE
jgi:hypothetical protein